MHMSCIYKTSDGKYKVKGKSKPKAIAKSKAQLKALKIKLGVN